MKFGADYLKQIDDTTIQDVRNADSLNVVGEKVEEYVSPADRIKETARIQMENIKGAQGVKTPSAYSVSDLMSGKSFAQIDKENKPNAIATVLKNAQVGLGKGVDALAHPIDSAEVLLDTAMYKNNAASAESRVKQYNAAVDYMKANGTNTFGGRTASQWRKLVENDKEAKAAEKWYAEGAKDVAELQDKTILSEKQQERIAKVEEDTAQLGDVGQFFAGLAQSAGAMGPSIIAGLATGGAASLAGAGAAAQSIGTAAGLSTMWAEVYGRDLKDLSQQGYEWTSASDKAFLDACVEVGTELFVGGTPGMRAGLFDNLLEEPIAKAANSIGNRFGQTLIARANAEGAGVFTSLAGGAIGSMLAKEGEKSFGKFIADVLGEGVEEMASAYLEPLVDRATINPDAPPAEVQDILLSGLGGSIMGAFFNLSSLSFTRATNENKVVVPGKDGGLEVKGAEDLTQGDLDAIYDNGDYIYANGPDYESILDYNNPNLEQVDTVTEEETVTETKRKGRRKAKAVAETQTVETETQTEETAPAQTAAEAQEDSRISINDPAAAYKNNVRSAVILINKVITLGYKGENLFGLNLTAKEQKLLKNNLLTAFMPEEILRYSDTLTMEDVDNYVHNILIPQYEAQNKIAKKPFRSKYGDTPLVRVQNEQGVWIPMDEKTYSKIQGGGKSFQELEQEQVANLWGTIRKYNSLLSDSGLSIDLEGFRDAPQAAGSYKYQPNTIYINANTVLNGTALNKVIAHELVHVAQRYGMGLTPFESTLNDLYENPSEWKADYQKSGLRDLRLMTNEAFESAGFTADEIKAMRDDIRETYSFENQYIKELEVDAVMLEILLGSPDVMLSAEINSPAGESVVQALKGYLTTKVEETSDPEIKQELETKLDEIKGIEDDAEEVKEAIANDEPTSTVELPYETELQGFDEMPMQENGKPFTKKQMDAFWAARKAQVAVKNPIDTRAEGVISENTAVPEQVETIGVEGIFEPASMTEEDLSAMAEQAAPVDTSLAPEEEAEVTEEVTEVKSTGGYNTRTIKSSRKDGSRRHTGTYDFVVTDSTGKLDPDFKGAKMSYFYDGDFVEVYRPTGIDSALRQRQNNKLKEMGFSSLKAPKLDENGEYLRDANGNIVYGQATGIWRSKTKIDGNDVDGRAVWTRHAGPDLDSETVGRNSKIRPKADEHLSPMEQAAKEDAELLKEMQLEKKAKRDAKNWQKDEFNKLFRYPVLNFAGVNVVFSDLAGRDEIWLNAEGRSLTAAERERLKGMGFKWADQYYGKVGTWHMPFDSEVFEALTGKNIDVDELKATNDGARSAGYKYSPNQTKTTTDSSLSELNPNELEELVRDELSEYNPKGAGEVIRRQATEEELAKYNPKFVGQNGKTSKLKPHWAKAQKTLKTTLKDIINFPDIEEEVDNTADYESIMDFQNPDMDEINRQWAQAGEKYGTYPKSDTPRQTTKNTFVNRTADQMMANSPSPQMTQAMRENILRQGNQFVHKSFGKLDGQAYSYWNQKKWLDENGKFDLGKAVEHWGAMAEAGQIGTPEGIARGFALWAKLKDTAKTRTLTNAELSAWDKLMSDIQIVSNQFGVGLGLFRHLKDMTGDGREYHMNRLVTELRNDLNQMKNAFRLKAANALDDYTIPDDLNAILKTPEDDDLIRNSTSLTDAQKEAMLKMSFDERIVAIEDAIKDDIAANIPPTIGSRMTAWRMLSMLGNIRTHLRNIISNAAMYIARNIRDVETGVIEDVFLKDGEYSRNTTISARANQALKNLTSGQWDIHAGNIQTGGKLGFTTDVMNRTRQFGNSTIGQAIERLSRWNSDLLEREDALFLRLTFKQSFASYAMANAARWGTTVDNVANFLQQDTAKSQEALNEALAYATREAQRATYREASNLATWLNAQAKKSTMGGLLIEGLLPFKRTPINILWQGVRYSPAGIINGLKELTLDLHNGKITEDGIDPATGKPTKTVADAIADLCAGMTGTMIMGLGYFLGGTGAMKAGGSDSDREEYYDEMLGNQPFSVTIGDTNITLDWLTPISMPLFAGVALAQAMGEDAENSDDEELDFSLKLNNVLDAIGTMSDPFTNLSLLQGVNEALNSYSDNKLGAVASSAVTSYAGQFVPTMAGQIARTLDPVRRSTYAPKDSKFVGGSTGERFYNKMKNKLPFISTTNEPYIDMWGRAEERDGNIITRAAEQMVVPWYAKKVNRTEVDDRLTEIFAENKSNTVLPNTPQSYYTIDDKKYYLKPEEYTAVKKTAGELSYQGIQDVFDTDLFNQLSSDDQADVIGDVYSYAKAVAKSDFAQSENIENFKPDSDIAKVKAAEALGLTMGEYFVIKKIMNSFDAKNDNGDSVRGLKKKRQNAWADSVGLSSAQRKLFMQ